MFVRREKRNSLALVVRERGKRVSAPKTPRRNGSASNLVLYSRAVLTIHPTYTKSTDTEMRLRPRSDS